MSSRAERTPAADWRTPRPHRFADRTPSTATSMSFKCPSSVSDSKLPFMGGAVQPISIGIMGFGSPWKGPPAPPDMRAPLCLSQAGLPSVTQKGVSPPSPLLFLSPSLFSSPSSVSDFTSTRTYKDHSQLTPVLILPLPNRIPITPNLFFSCVVCLLYNDRYLLVLYCYSQFLYTI